MRLATGKKVNTASIIRSPISPRLALSARASDLSALVDNIAQAQQTVKAVGQAIGSLTKLVQAAQALAQQARVSPTAQVSYAAISQAGSTAISGETIGSVTGDPMCPAASPPTSRVCRSRSARRPTPCITRSSPAPENVNAILSRINNTPGLGAAVTASLDQTGHHIQLTANSSDTSFQVLSSAAATTLGIDGLSGNSTNLLQAVAGLAGTSLTVASSAGIQKTITFGNGGSNVSTLAELQSALSGTGVSAANDIGGGLNLAVAASAGAANSLTTSGTALAALGLAAAGTVYGAVGATTPDPSRASYQAQYNNLLQQIDSLSLDASYHGINLLRGDQLQTTLNETGTSSITVSGVSFDSTGLGLATLTGDDFQSDTVIGDTLGKLGAALATLRAQASQFGSSLSMLQTREDFSTDD